MKKIIYLVIPCYNEEEVLLETSKQLNLKLSSLIDKGIISESSKIVFVNDGSKDNTWNLIKQLNNECKIFQGINLSKNRGHQNALLAGLMTVKDHCDAAISLDADLQDDIGVIDKFIDKFLDGYDIVYGVRSSRDKDSFFKRNTAQGFYKILNKLGGEIVYNHADYRLMSKRALEGLSDFKEVNLFLRGIVPMIGYNWDTVEYERQERLAGVSKYPLKKMLSFAIDGITSLSTKPIRMISILGLCIFTISVLLSLYFLANHFFGYTVPGWTTIVLSMWALGGLNLLAIGIIGEYVGKIYLETKNRPRFIIQEYLK